MMISIAPGSSFGDTITYAGEGHSSPHYAESGDVIIILSRDANDNTSKLIINFIFILFFI